MRKTFCLNLCQRTFLHWESLSAYTSMAYMCFEYADYGSDGTGDSWLAPLIFFVSI